MAKQRATGFVVAIDSSIKLSNSTKTQVTAAIGAAAAAELARLDLGGNVAFVPRIKWPGGRVIDLNKFLTSDQLKEIDAGGMPGIG